MPLSQTVTANVINGRRVVKNLILKLLWKEMKCFCGSLLKKSLMTFRGKVPTSLHYKNALLLINKYF
jgi:hypothetical protein